MKRMISKKLFCLSFVIILAGCTLPKQAGKLENKLNQTADTYLCDSFGPAKIQILPLTEMTGTDKGQKINVFVSLLDAFSCSQKWPAVFRFELYEQVPRSAEPVGRRIRLWPDIDLTAPEKNNRYWQDFLRAYKFNLDIDLGDKQNYILQITCILANEKRLTAQFPVKPVI
jgi:hypothetical protein